MELTIRTSDAGLTVTADLYGGSDGWLRMEAHLPRQEMTLTELQLRLVHDAQKKLRLMEQALKGEPVTGPPF